MLRVKQVMYHTPQTLAANATLSEAADIYLCGPFTCAPIISEHDKIVGIITIRELIKALRAGKSFDTPVVEVMDRNLVSIHEDTPFHDVAHLPLERLLVVDNDQKLKGILTRLSLINQVYEALQETENQLEVILQAVPNGIIAVNEEGEIIHFNAAAEKILGMPAKAILGRKIKDVFPEGDLLTDIKANQVINGRRVILNDNVIILSENPLYFNNKVAGAVAVLQDISALENAYNELSAVKALNNELESIIASSYDGIVVLGRDKHVLRFNSSYERILGEAGCNFQENKYLDDIFQQVTHHKKPATVKVITAAGRDVLITGNPVFTEEGTIARVVVNIRDMTELNRLQAELEQNRDATARLTTELNELRARLLETEKIIFKSKQMERIVEQAIRVAHVDSTVLLTGESGVGKEVIAKIIHRTSPRHNGPFVQVNCGAIPENLLESELFGYEEGAFTGATRGGKIGLLECANGGTVLLDEIGEMPLNLQVKLLRILQDQQLFRVGGRKPIALNIRIIAATNQDLRQLVAEKRFRQDLYYRLNVVPIEIPPLRERKEDILPLARAFLQKYNQRYGLNKQLGEDVFAAFISYTWPGNVRELENLVERLVVTTEEKVITCKSLPAYICKDRGQGGVTIYVDDLIPLNEATRILEKKLISRALQEHHSLRRAGESLGIAHSTLLRKAREYGLVQQSTTW
ncbi:Anaerobic nitric oxide reductase transcription regulator NorR [Neomoorella glycerini]|uniref:HTH-type transcriptional regulatory protein TyrR n=1 Tax=Neomoorella glycerini TaxID=55779 RepID=A0A6I5ZNS7_9FIRM|nr:sigma-54-dependent Fis family transcriptional regulator [Moorella glycerini]QGP91572.1 Anaerobic nitric oxide reductase transcription regulator NorR [Moorella glycerini]